MVDRELLNAYRWHRQHTAGRNFARTATDCFYSARKDAAAYDAAIAAGDTSTASKYRRYPGQIYPAVCWQPRQAGLAFIQNVDGAGLRHIGNVEAEPGGRNGYFSKRDSCGWYSDNDQNETIHGVVYQLPGRDGKARFVAGYAASDDSDGLPTLDLGTIFEEDCRNGDQWNVDARDLDAARDAARAADSMAKECAEESRDYSAAWSAGSQYAELGEQIASDRKEALQLLIERRAAAKSGKGESYGAICAAIRGTVSHIVDAITEARQERDKLKEGDHVSEWLPGFYSCDKRLQEAFNDGAGETVFSI